MARGRGKRTPETGAPGDKKFERKLDTRTVRKPFHAEDVREEKYGTQADKMGSLNDRSWYMHYPILSDGAGRIQFVSRPGMKLEATASTSYSITDYVVPGVMCLKWGPAVGFSQDESSAVSQAARSIWVKVRQAFSSELKVDPPDFVPYIMGLDSIYSYIAWLKRVYCLADWYSANNRAVPNALLMAMGFTGPQIDHIRSHKADFNLAINSLIKRVAKFTMPFNIDILKRHYWLNMHVFSDAPTINSQLYLFDQEYYFKYSDQVPTSNDASVKATGCTPVFKNLTGNDVIVTMFDFGTALIDAIASSDDALTMDGYLRRAYGDTSAFVVEELPLVTDFDIKYEPEVLTQIENSQTVAAMMPNEISSAIYAPSIQQNTATNAIVSQPAYQGLTADISFSGFSEGMETVMNVPFTSRNDAPGVDEVLEISRLKATVSGDPAVGTAGGYGIICGTELPITWLLYIYNAATDSVEIQPYWTKFIDYSTSKLTAVTDKASASVEANVTIKRAGAFDWRPLVEYITTNDGTSSIILGALQFSGDIHNITMAYPRELMKMHDIC